MQVVTVATMKQREEAANRVGVSYETMMEQAAAAAFARLQRENRVKNRKIAVLCGSGNNGGDAYELAERLLQNGARVWILP